MKTVAKEYDDFLMIRHERITRGKAKRIVKYFCKRHGLSIVKDNYGDPEADVSKYDGPLDAFMNIKGDAVNLFYGRK